MVGCVDFSIVLPALRGGPQGPVHSERQELMGKIRPFRDIDKEGREDHKIHGTGKILHPSHIDGEQQADRT